MISLLPIKAIYIIPGNRYSNGRSTVALNFKLKFQKIVLFLTLILVHLNVFHLTYDRRAWNLIRLFGKQKHFWLFDFIMSSNDMALETEFGRHVHTTLCWHRFHWNGTCVKMSTYQLGHSECKQHKYFSAFSCQINQISVLCQLSRAYN